MNHSMRFSFALEVCEVVHELSPCTGLTVLDYSDTCFREELRRSDPINPVRVYGPTSILRLTHPTDWNTRMAPENAQCST